MGEAYNTIEQTNVIVQDGILRRIFNQFWATRNTRNLFSDLDPQLGSHTKSFEWDF